MNIENKTNWNSNTLIKTNLAKILKHKSYLMAKLNFFFFFNKIYL